MSKPKVINDDNNITMIIDICKSLDDCGDNALKVQQLIQSLSCIQVNVNILKKTNAGKKMTKFSKHKVPTVRKAAKELIAKWKKDVELSNSKKSVRSSNEDRLSSDSNLQSTQPSNSSKKQCKSSENVVELSDGDEDKKPNEEDKAQSSEAEEEVEAEYTSDPIRINIRETIKKQLLKSDPTQGKKAAVIARKIEVSLIQHFAATRSEYTNKARMIIANIMRSKDFK